jgi:predicted nucleotidyltransferase
MPMPSTDPRPRLSQRERDGIRRAVVRACAEAAATWRRIVLFGSRADPDRRGGDIDLLVELAPGHEADTYRLTQRLRLALEDEIGPQRVDLVLDDGRAAGGFADLARETGIELWSNT